MAIRVSPSKLCPRRAGDRDSAPGRRQRRYKPFLSNQKVMDSPGADDKKYLALMARYKMLRCTLGIKANAYLEAAVQLRESGDVSEKAIIGAAYL